MSDRRFTDAELKHALTPEDFEEIEADIAELQAMIELCDYELARQANDRAEREARRDAPEEVA